MADPIRVGPVVGEVDASSARVLLQLERPGTVEVALRPAAGTPVTVQATTTVRREVVVLACNGLTPDTEYALGVRVDGSPVPERPGRVVTKPAAPEALRLAALSCNFTIRQGGSRLWERLWEKWVRPGTIDTVLHVGDQIYGDTVFGQALADVRERGRTQAVRGKWERAFEDLHLYTWNHPPTRSVLAHASNLMIWDDHELRNSWGGFDHDRDPGSDERFVGSIARTVYQRFQRALWSNPDPTVTHEAHAHAYGNVGVVFLDQRTGRSFRYDPERPYLGPTQWAWLRAELASGSLSNVGVLAVVTSVPLCYVGRVTAGAGGFAVRDLRDHWSHPDHVTEQIELLTEIRRWLEADAKRRLLVVGGDVHVGGLTRVEYRAAGGWEPLCTQIITSPITNRPPNGALFFGLRELLLRGVHDVGGSYRFDHDEGSFTNRRNFAILTLRASAGHTARIHASLETDADD